MKVLHLPSSVGGQGWGLAQGERKIGIDSKVLIRKANGFNYSYDFNMGLEMCNHNISKLWKCVNWFYKVYKSDYDILHFNFGSTILDFTNYGFGLPDLRFYKKKGRGIFVTYNGCDARQKYVVMNSCAYSACHRSECSKVCNNPKTDAKKRANIECFDNYADGIFAITPDLLRFLPKRAIYLPKTISSWDKLTRCPVGKDKKLRIVHAPTNRVIKGSDYILPVLMQIKAKYQDEVEIILVENMSNEKALSIYAQADLVIDQILIGWYGGLAVEVMKMGKPVMCFIRESDYELVPDNMAIDCKKTIINVTKDTIFNKLCMFIENRSSLQRISDRSLEYVETWHNPVKIAGMVKRYYEKSIENSFRR